MEAGEVKEVFRETYGLTGLITNGHFEAFSEWRHPQNRYFKDDHFDPAAGDYEPIQRDKQRTRIEGKQCTTTLVWIHDSHEKEGHKQLQALPLYFYYIQNRIPPKECGFFMISIMSEL